jgi:hypothetical protein
MKAYDSLGFFIFGHLMVFFPALLPGAFPPGSLDGANTSVLWLVFMGIVNNLAGAGILAQSIPALLERLLAWRMPLVAAAELAPMLRPELPDYAGTEPEPGERLAA